MAGYTATSLCRDNESAFLPVFLGRQKIRFYMQFGKKKSLGKDQQLNYLETIEDLATSSHTKIPKRKKLLTLLI